MTKKQPDSRTNTIREVPIPGGPRYPRIAGRRAVYLPVTSLPWGFTSQILCRCLVSSFMARSDGEEAERTRP